MITVQKTSQKYNSDHIVLMYGVIRYYHFGSIHTTIFQPPDLDFPDLIRVDAVMCGLGKRRNVLV